MKKTLLLKYSLEVPTTTELRIRSYLKKMYLFKKILKSLLTQYRFKDESEVDNLNLI